jgi:hypothetical protein
MSGVLAPQWIFQALTDAGDVASGARLFSFVGGGGSVPSPLYADKALTTPLANPYEFDSAGRGQFWLDSSITYRLRLETATGVLIEERDGVEGAAGMATLANSTDPTQGAGLIGIYGSNLRDVMDRFEINLLRFIPSTEWAGIRNGVTTYDCTPALEAAIAASVYGAGIYAPAGHYKFYTSCRIKKGVHIRGDGGLALFGGTTFYKAADVLTFDTCADGIYTTSENWINAPTWEQIRFQTLQPAGQPKWTSDFIMERLCLGGGFIKCIFNGEGQGAALALERVQDKALDSVFFRGMGEELGGKAQLYLMPPRVTINPAIPFDDSVNEIRAYACHFEWNHGVGTYTNPETGLTNTTARSVAIKSLHRDGSLSNNTGIKFCESKFETGTSAEFNGIANQRAAIYLDRALNFQFIEGNFNQTNRVFEGVGCRNIRIHGTVVKYDPSTAPGFFAKFTNTDVIDIDVSGYVNPALANQFPGCTRVNEKAVNASEFSTFSQYASDDIARHGRKQLRNYAGRTNGSVIDSITTPTKTAILSNEISFAANYGDVLLGFPAKYISRFRNGMTLRFKASASLAGHAIFASYHSYPATSRTQGDGVNTDFPIGVFFPVDIDFPWLIPVTVQLQNRITGATTAQTAGVDYTLTGESDFQGGTVALLVAPSADYDVIISRAIMRKNILSVIVSTSPTWYSVFIPPAVLKLENVYLCLTAAPTSEVAGLYYTIHEFEPLDYAEATATPYYPALAVNLGPGQPPIAGGGYGCGWEVGAFVKAVNASTKDPILLGWECTSSTGNGGVGSFREVYADRETSIVNTGTTSYTLPAPTTQTIGARRRYTNNGTATITVTAFAGDTFAKCSQTVLSLGVGESVLLEYTAANVWSILDGLVSLAEITYSGSVAQTINTATTTKLTSFNTNAVSLNCTADQANDKITTTREALYELEANLSWYTGTITNFTVSIFVDGSLAGISAVEYFGATGSATSQVEAIALRVPGVRIAAGKDIDLRIAHSDAGSVIIGVVRASLSARRIGA